MGRYDAKKILQMNWDATKSDELGIKGMMVPPEVLDESAGVTWDLLVDQNPWVHRFFPSVALRYLFIAIPSYRY